MVEILKWLKALLIEWNTLDCYGYLGVLNSVEITGLIINWKEVTRLFDFDKILVTYAWKIHHGRFPLPFSTKFKNLKEQCLCASLIQVRTVSMCIPDPINI